MMMNPTNYNELPFEFSERMHQNVFPLTAELKQWNSSGFSIAHMIRLNYLALNCHNTVTSSSVCLVDVLEYHVQNDPNKRI